MKPGNENAMKLLISILIAQERSVESNKYNGSDENSKVNLQPIPLKNSKDYYEELLEFKDETKGAPDTQSEGIKKVVTSGKNGKVLSPVAVQSAAPTILFQHRSKAFNFSKQVPAQRTLLTTSQLLSKGLRTQ